MLTGSTPIAVVLAAIPILTALHVVGGKVKGEGMKTGTVGGDAPKGPNGSVGPKGNGTDTRTTIWNKSRKWVGQSLIVIAGMGSSMAAAVATSTL